jgi:hypothetical protein
LEFEEFIPVSTRVQAGDARARREARKAIHIFCWILGHRRSRSRAWFDDRLGLWRSYCRRCGTPLLREKEGKWRRD